MSRPLISFLIWLVAVAGAAFLWLHTRGPREPFPGLAGEVPVAISVAAPGRLVAVQVEVGDAVEAGALLVRLDPAEAEANIEVARAELAAALADVEAEAARVAEERRQAELDLLARSVQAKAAIDDAQGRRQAAQAEFRSLSTALGKLRGVAEAGLARSDQVANLEGRRARVQGEAAYGPAAVAAWREFSERLDASMATLATQEVYLAPFRARVELARRQVDAFMVQRANCDLLAPQAGRVSRVLARPGQAVTEGLPVVELVEAGPAVKVLAWLPEERTRLLSVDDEVSILPRDRQAARVVGSVVRLGPAIELLPERLWLDTNTPSWGRVVHIKAHEPLLPGEALQVSKK